jgi:hypothetical protein
MNSGCKLKKALKRNDLPTDFATWNAIARDKSRWWLFAPSTSTPSPSTPSATTPSPPTPSTTKQNQPPANPYSPLPGNWNLAPAFVVPTWYAPFAQAQYAETRTAYCAARYAARANRANAPPQQRHPAPGMAIGN